MKTVCVYHSVDLDGWMSAAIVKHWWKEQNKAKGQKVLDYIFKDDELNVIVAPFGTLTFIGYNYGDPIPNLSEYDKVIMCDISFPKEEMTKLNYNLGVDFIWIDHHISAMLDNDSIQFLEGLRNNKLAACELTWQYFFPNETMPEIVRLLGRYDCFGHKGTDEERKVLEFQYGARASINNYEEAYNHLVDEANDYKVGLTTVETIWYNGCAIYKYLCTEAKQTYKKGFEIIFTILENEDTIWKYKFICINKSKFNPINFGIDYHKNGYDGVACFSYSNNKWGFSLYNHNGEVDCSDIAKRFGGGGHKGAAGFAVNNIEEFLNKYKV